MPELDGSDWTGQKKDSGVDSAASKANWDIDLAGRPGATANKILIASNDWSADDDGASGDRPVAPIIVPAQSEGQGGSSSSSHVLQGGIEKHGRARGLRGETGRDDDGNPLRGEAGKDDDGNALRSGTAQEDRDKPLRARADEEDSGEMKIAWDKWHNKVLNAIGDNISSIMNRPENMVPHRVPGGFVYTPRVALGAAAAIDFKVTPDGHVIDVQVIDPSRLPQFDANSPAFDPSEPRPVYDPVYLQAVKMAIYGLEGKRVLKFPRGSKRTEAWENGIIQASTHESRANFNWGDDERQRNGQVIDDNNVPPSLRSGGYDGGSQYGR